MLPFFIYHVQNGMRVHREMLHQIPFSDLLVCLQHCTGIEILLIFDTEIQTYFWEDCLKYEMRFVHAEI